MNDRTKYRILQIVRAMAKDRVLLDPTDAELMLAVREQVFAELGSYYNLTSTFQAEIIATYDKWSQT